MSPWILGILLLFTVLLILKLNKNRSAIRRHRFDKRESLSLVEVQQRFYPQIDVSIISELWIEISNSVEVPVGLLRPSDRFDDELGPVKGYPVASEMDELHDSFERRCKTLALDPHTTTIETVDDYIRFFTG